MLDQVARHLGRGGDDGVEEALAAGRLEDTAQDAGGHRVAALDRGGGQQYLAHQRAPRRQLAQRRRPQVFLRGVVVAGGERDPGQQQAAAGGGQPAGQLGRGAQVAERQAQQRLQLIGPRQQHRPGPGQDRARRLDGGQRVADLPAGGPDPGPVQQRQELEERAAARSEIDSACSASCSAVSRSRRSSARPASARR